MLFHFIFF